MIGPAPPPRDPAFVDAVPDIALWRPSLVMLLAAGAISGTLLGLADALLFQVIVDDAGPSAAAARWGAGLGLVGGVILVILRRAIWGPDVSVEVGTVLGLLYGLGPGVAVVAQIVTIGGSLDLWFLGGMMAASSMAGLLIGGILDRATESVVARVRKLQD